MIIFPLCLRHSRSCSNPASRVLGLSDVRAFPNLKGETWVVTVPAGQHRPAFFTSSLYEAPALRATAKTPKSPPLAPASRFPNLPRCACADLRYRSALSTPPCSVARVGIPLSLRFLPAFARWRSAYVTCHCHNNGKCKDREETLMSNQPTARSATSCRLPP
jgi:hypothetical protein